MVTSLAVLERCEEASIDIVQAERVAPIYLTPRGVPRPDAVRAVEPR